MSTAAETTALATIGPVTSPLDALLVDPDKLKEIPVDTLERLWVMQKDMLDRDAKQRFFAAFNAIQKELGPVKKAAKNQHTDSHYALLEHVSAMLDPIVTDHGFSTSVSHGDDTGLPPNWVRVILIIRHIDGHQETYNMKAPIDTKGPKGGDTKTELHGVASSTTYIGRHLLCDVFRIQLVKDDDGNAGGGPRPEERQQQRRKPAAAQNGNGHAAADIPNAEPWNLPEGTNPATKDIGLCVDTKVKPAHGSLVRIQVKGKIRTVKVDKVIDKIENPNGVWFVCTPLAEQPPPQQQRQGPDQGFVGQEVDRDDRVEDVDTTAGGDQPQGQEPDPDWLDDDDSDDDGHTTTMDNALRKKNVAAEPYKFNPKYDDGREGYGAKAFEEVEPGDELLIETRSGKTWTEIVVEMVRKATLQDIECWICITKKPPEDGES